MECDAVMEISNEVADLLTRDCLTWHMESMQKELQDHLDNPEEHYMHDEDVALNVRLVHAMKFLLDNYFGEE